MRYWPLSVIAAHVPELHGIYQSPRLSQNAMWACNKAAGETEACETPLIIIESVGAPARRMYTEYPEFQDWFKLERAGFVETESGFFGLVIDALH